MKAVLDVHYDRDQAVAACVVFCSWQDSQPVKLIRTTLPPARQYHAGRFYERELPCLLSVLQEAEVEFETIIIDGFVHLRPEVGKGLGVYLAESLSYPVSVMGVAKKVLKVAERYVQIHRGRSTKPLYISAIGCPLEYAAQSIRSMHGPYRIPTLLKIVDQHARSA